MLLTLLLVTPLLLAQATPPVRGYTSVPDPPRRGRTEVIIVSPPPSPMTPGQTIILERDRAGRLRVTVCGWTAGVLLCTK